MAVESSPTLVPKLLPEAAGPLVARYDAALLDLDGVLYVGRSVVPGAARAVEAVRATGARVGFVTNNASRGAAEVAAHLTGLGIRALASDVVTSAQAAARVLAERLPAGAAVLVVGAPSLAVEVRARGLRVVVGADDGPEAVVQGFAPDIGWRQLAEAAVAVSRGCLWVGTNGDQSLPSPRGPVPGNGALLAAVAHATGRSPLVVGKPDPALHHETIARIGARRPIVVGDRLDTDIEGAALVGCDSLLVLSGVTGARDLLQAPAQRRPTYVAADVSGLLRPQPRTVRQRAGASCGGWQSRRVGGSLTLAQSSPLTWPVDTSGRAAGASGERRANDIDALRALCVSAWSGDGSDGAGADAPVQPADDAARAALIRLGL